MKAYSRRNHEYWEGLDQEREFGFQLLSQVEDAAEDAGYVLLDKELARYLGVSLPRISKWRHKRVNVSKKYWPRLFRLRDKFRKAAAKGGEE